MVAVWGHAVVCPQLWVVSPSCALLEKHAALQVVFSPHICQCTSALLQPDRTALCAADYAGSLLGAGSCSRVYKGKWHNRDVAVRVMPHDGLMLGQEQHMQQLTSLDHLNVVRTFLGVTYTRQGTTAAVHQHVGVLDSAQQLAKHDAVKAASSSRDQHTLQHSIQQQEQQQFMVIAGSSPSTPMMADMVSTTSSMPLSPMSISIAGSRASDSSTCAHSPRAALQQLRPARASASSLAGDMEAEAETWFVQVCPWQPPQALPLCVLRGGTKGIL